MKKVIVSDGMLFDSSFLILPTIFIFFCSICFLFVLNLIYMKSYLGYPTDRFNFKEKSINFKPKSECIKILNISNYTIPILDLTQL